MLVLLMDTLVNECQKERKQTVEREWVVVVVKEQDGREETGRDWGENGKCKIESFW